MKPYALAVMIGLAMAAGSQGPAFEVASIKAATNDGPRNSSSYGPQGVTFRGVSLGFVIAEAYHFPGGRIVGPGSMTNEALWPYLARGYDITARVEHPVSKDQLRLMLQTLLADRFDLKLHRAERTLPVYNLVVAKTGLKIQESADGGDLAILEDANALTFRNAELMRLAGALSGRLDRPVLNATGRTGLYTFTLKKPVDAQLPANVKSERLSPETPSAVLFDESLKTLGLELVKATGPVEYLVIDSVQKPSEN
jgi:uncharacterized protein (TIGR03435 family)